MASSKHCKKCTGPLSCRRSTYNVLFVQNAPSTGPRCVLARPVVNSRKGCLLTKYGAKGGRHKATLQSGFLVHLPRRKSRSVEVILPQEHNHPIHPYRSLHSRPFKQAISSPRLLSYLITLTLNLDTNPFCRRD